MNNVFQTIQPKKHIRSYLNMYLPYLLIFYIKDYEKKIWSCVAERCVEKMFQKISLHFAGKNNYRKINFPFYATHVCRVVFYKALAIFLYWPGPNLWEWLLALPASRAVVFFLGEKRLYNFVASEFFFFPHIFSLALLTPPLSRKQEF